MSECPPVHKRQRRGWRAALRVLARDSHAGTAIEYGLIASLVIITMFASFQALANLTVSMWNDVSAKVINAH